MNEYFIHGQSWWILFTWSNELNFVHVDRVDELYPCGQSWWTLSMQSSSTLSMQISSTLFVITLLSIRDFSCFYINHKQKEFYVLRYECNNIIIFAYQSHNKKFYYLHTNVTIIVIYWLWLYLALGF